MLSRSVTVTVPLTVKSFVILTLLLGILILPVPLALNSKLLLLRVVVIKLSSILISSKLASPLTVSVPVTVASPTLNDPLVCTFVKSALPLIVKSFVITTLLFGIDTVPEPLALSSRLLLLLVVVITLSLISMSSKLAWPLTVSVPEIFVVLALKAPVV